MPDDYELEEVHVDEVDEDFSDDWGEPSFDDEEKFILAFVAGIGLAYLWLTRPKTATQDQIYAADLARASGPVRR